MSEIKQKLKEMAQLSMLAGRISSVHEKNLKAYPFVCFENVKQVKIDYDLGHAINDKEVHHNSHVFYHLTVSDNAPNENFKEKRHKAIETCVRDLFWKDVAVKVYINEKLVFESKDVKKET